jgi:hypothetical protein
VLVALAVLVVE